MRLLTVTEEEGRALLASDEGDEELLYNTEDGFAKLRWFRDHGAGSFLEYCCGMTTVPEELVPRAELAAARRQADEALRRVLANAATIVRLSWSDGATAADRANLERIKTAAADIAQDHKILRAALAGGGK